MKRKGISKAVIREVLMSGDYEDVIDDQICIQFGGPQIMGKTKGIPMFFEATFIIKGRKVRILADIVMTVSQLMKGEITVEAP